MTIGTVLLVKDEIDLLRRNVAYHSSVGVDYFVICDRGSNDEAQRQLEDLARSDNVHLFRQHVYKVRNIDAQAMKAVRLAALKRMRRVFAPHWLFPADTDEFWVPRCGDLASCVRGLQVEHLQVDRFNAALRRDAVPTLFENLEGGRALLDQDIIVKREELSPRMMKANPGIPWVFNDIMSKFITAGTDFVEVAPGFHNVRYSLDRRRGSSPDLLILHFPFTSFGRFAQKIASVREHLEHVGHTFKGERAWHWRRWASLERPGALRGEFDKQFFGPSHLEDLRRRGIVMKIRDYFATLTRAESGAQEVVEGRLV